MLSVAWRANKTSVNIIFRERSHRFFTRQPLVSVRGGEGEGHGGDSAHAFCVKSTLVGVRIKALIFSKGTANQVQAGTTQTNQGRLRNSLKNGVNQGHFVDSAVLLTTFCQCQIWIFWWIQSHMRKRFRECNSSPRIVFDEKSWECPFRTFLATWHRNIINFAKMFWRQQMYSPCPIGGHKFFTFVLDSEEMWPVDTICFSKAFCESPRNVSINRKQRIKIQKRIVQTLAVFKSFWFSSQNVNCSICPYIHQSRLLPYFTYVYMFARGSSSWFLSS